MTALYSRRIDNDVKATEQFDCLVKAVSPGFSITNIDLKNGSLSTLHANGPKDALNRLETMVLMSGIEIPVLAIREYIEKAIDIVVSIERLQDGKRKITSISEVTDIKDGEINLKEIFAFKEKGLTSSGEVNGSYIMYKYKPYVYQKIKSKGINDIDDIYEKVK